MYALFVKACGSDFIGVSDSTSHGVSSVLRSSDDDYCPVCQVDVIQQKTVDMLRTVYPDTQIFFNYSSKTTETSDVNSASDVNGPCDVAKSVLDT